MNGLRFVILTIAIIIIQNCIAISAGPAQTSKAAKNKETAEQMTNFGSFRVIHSAQETTFRNIAAEETIIAVNNWDLIKKEYVCIVTALKPDYSQIPICEFSFYEKKKDKLVKKYAYETMASFLSMYPLSDAGGNLLTIWVGGSGYQFLVFSISGDEIKIVFDDGSKGMPEIIDIDNDGKYELLVMEGAFTINYKTKEVITLPEGTDVYKWNGNTYVKIGFIPWGNKLAPLRKVK
jgi:hypothetical protein